MNDSLTLLQTYCLHLEALSELLDREKTCIESNQMDNFTTLLQDKERAVEAIKSAQTELNTLRGSLSVDEFLSSQGVKGDAILSKVQTLAHDCDTKSQINMMLVLASKQMTTTLLDSLTGRTRHQTYSKHAHQDEPITSTRFTRI